MRNNGSLLTAMTDSRREARVALLKPFQTSEGEGLGEIILDYSSEGCRILSPIIYNVGDRTIIDLGRFTGDSATGARNVRLGEVVWQCVGKGGTGEYGIKFV